MQPVHCSPSAFGLLLHRNRSLALLSAAGLPSAAFKPSPARNPLEPYTAALELTSGTCHLGLHLVSLGSSRHRQTLPGTFGLVLQHSLARLPFARWLRGFRMIGLYSISLFRACALELATCFSGMVFPLACCVGTERAQTKQSGTLGMCADAAASAC